MPFGLSGAASTFQRAADHSLADLKDFATAFQDDILIFSKNMQDHINHIELVLKRLKEHGWTPNWEKSLFAATKLEYCGYIISSNGFEMDPNRLLKSDKIKIPSNLNELRALLGFANYYNKFIPKYAEISEPLYRLTSTRTKWIWSKEHQDAYNNLINALKDPKMLKHPNFAKPFFIFSDASNNAAGFVLTQLLNNKHVPISFGGKIFNHTERNYSTSHKELYAVVLAPTPILLAAFQDG